MAAFFSILGLSLVKLGLPPAFLAATACSLLVQVGALSLIGRGQVFR